ncbi:MAG: hypothetical protein AAB929_03455 [Patescibacteria group bacterium]
MENLGVDPKLLIAQLINFGLFFFIFSKFIAKPFLAHVASEKKKDAERSRLNELAVKQDADLVKKEEEMKVRLRKEYDKALLEAKHEAESVKANLMKDAKHEAEEYVSNAQKQMQSDKLAMEGEIKEKIASLSVLLVEQGLREYLTDDMQKGVTKQLLTHLESKSLN